MDWGMKQALASPIISIKQAGWADDNAGLILPKAQACGHRAKSGGSAVSLLAVIIVKRSRYSAGMTLDKNLV